MWKMTNCLFGASQWSFSSSKVAADHEFGLGSVSSIAVQVDRREEHEGRDVRVAPLLTGPSSRQMCHYVSAHVRWTIDDDRSGFLLCVTATSFPGGVKEGQLSTLHIGR